MKAKLLILLFIWDTAYTVSAQKPFKEIGKDGEVELQTLSNGRYTEYFENDTLRQIGSVMFNTVTNKVEYFIPEDDAIRQKIVLRAKETSRYMSVDPKSAKYPYSSPYAAFGDNPIIFIDPTGGIIKIAFTDPDLKTKYEALVKNSFAGKVEAKVETDGTVTFHQVADTKLDQYETAALNELNNVAGASQTVTQTLYDSKGADIGDFNSAAYVDGGRYKDGALDLDDVAKYGNDNTRMTSKGVLAHEAVEQLEKQKRKELGYDVDDNEGTNFSITHQTAKAAENTTTQFQRTVGNLGYVDDDEGNRTFYKYKINQDAQTGQNTSIDYQQLSKEDYDTEFKKQSE